MSELHLVNPTNGTKKPKGVVFSVNFEQQVQGGPSQGAATLQFSNSPAGPWETARSIGDGGAVQANAVPWSAQNTVWQLPEAAIYEPAYVRGAVFDDQGLTGPPFLESNVIMLGVQGMTSTPAPEDPPRAPSGEESTTAGKKTKKRDKE